MKKRTVAILLAIVLVFGAAVGGTLAWLLDTTVPVTNTFTVGDVEITLDETWNTDADKDGKNDSWSAQLIPGKEYAKNPVVAVDGKETNVDVYLFVKFEEINSPKTYLAYQSTMVDEYGADANGWTKLTGVDGVNDVWYRVVAKDAQVKSWELLDGNKVTVLSTLEKEDMPEENLPALRYTAYAIQTEGSANAAEAWEKLNG